MLGEEVLEAKTGALGFFEPIFDLSESLVLTKSIGLNEYASDLDFDSYL